MKQELFPFGMEQRRDPSTQALSNSHQRVLEWHEKTTRNFENSRSIGTSFCCFHDKCVEDNPCPRILSLHTSGTHSAILVPSNSNEQRPQFLFHLVHNDVPIS